MHLVGHQRRPSSRRGRREPRAVVSSTSSMTTGWTPEQVQEPHLDSASHHRTSASSMGQHADPEQAQELHRQRQSPTSSMAAGRGPEQGGGGESLCVAAASSSMAGATQPEQAAAGAHHPHGHTTASSRSVSTEQAPVFRHHCLRGRLPTSSMAARLRPEQGGGPSSCGVISSASSEGREHLEQAQGDPRHHVGHDPPSSMAAG